MVAQKNAVEVRRVYNSNQYDVFFGNGWEDWSRVMMIKGTPVQIGGRKRTEEELQIISKAIRG